MEVWILGAKLATLAYLVIAFVLGGQRIGFPEVIFALAFAALTVLSRLLKPAALRRAFLALSAAAPIAGYALVSRHFIVLFPIAGAELIHELSGNLWLAAIPPLVPLLFVGGDTLPPYALSAGTGTLLYALCARLSARISLLEGRAERMRDEIEKFRASADRGAEYRDELSRLSQLEERNRISQEIHDRVGHSIAGAVMQLEAASALLDTDREAARTMLARGADALREGMGSIRETLRGIKPAAEQLGIRRIKTMLDGFSASGPISARLEFDGNLSVITQPQWKVITDNVREALTNASRHSEARSVRVKVEAMNRLVKAEIRDDGRGAYAIAKGLGLSGMEERAGAIGGTVIFDGARGFSVITLLPIAAGGADAD